jgi:TolB-like protein/Tfp pilus assembly protein PilF/predicted Ser/Thr protein kinase
MNGRTLGHYRIVDRLGSGGMGVVWLAEDLKLGRKVALKVLREDLAGSPEKAARFEREARAIAALSHPSIVTLHAVEEIDGVRFLAMEYLEGRTLDQLVREGPLPVAEIVRIALPIASALEAAHARGILHRDLKPSNVMVCTDGRVKVLDFGLAKLLEDPAKPVDGKGEPTLTREGQVVGTLHYSSPEQLRQEAVDARTDIYSLGAVLYEMATGRVPFEGDSAAQVITAVLCDVPRRIDELGGSEPRELADLVAGCLAKDSDCRPATAGATRRQLLEIAKSAGGARIMSGETSERRSAGASRKTAAALLGMAGALASAFVLLKEANWQRRHADLRQRTSIRGVESLPRDAPSIVVLPFRGASLEQAYLDGMTDGVISALGRFPDLRVISRQSSNHYKGSKKSIGEIAEELGVQFVAEGTVERVEGRIQVEYRLVQANPPVLLWEHRLERAAEEILALHEQVAERLGSIGETTQLPSDRTARGPRAVDPQAYEAYLKGRFLADQMTPAAIDQSIGYFEDALGRDPGFSLAYLGLADALGIKAYLYEDPRIFASKQEEAIQAAIEVDPESGLAHAMLGEQRRYYHWDWPGAEAAFARAVQLEPGNARVRRCYWAFLVSLGRFEDARSQLDVARRLDPLASAIPFDAGYQALMEGDVETALLETRRALEIQPDYPWAQAVLWLLGHYGEVREDERDAALSGFLHGLGYSDLAEDFVGASSSRSYLDRLLQLAHSLEERSRSRRVPVGLGAMIFAAAGDLDGAEKWILRAYAKRDPELVWLAQDTSLSEVRERPAIQGILKEMKLIPNRKATVHSGKRSDRGLR